MVVCKHNFGVAVYFCTARQLEGTAEKPVEGISLPTMLIKRDSVRLLK